jgi:hypothetical protein
MNKTADKIVSQLSRVIATNVGLAVINEISAQGLPVHMDTEYCRAYKERHDQCRGCESVQGCGKFCDIMQLIADSQIVPSLDFVNTWKSQNQFVENLKEILNN